MDFNPPISAWVKARRKQLDLTQTGLAHRAHYSVNVIRKVEAQSRPVSRALAEALRVALEVPADDLRVDGDVRTQRGHRRHHVARLLLGVGGAHAPTALAAPTAASAPVPAPAEPRSTR